MARLNTVLLLLIYSLHQAASVEVYITANSTDLCTSSCLTLTEFVANIGNLFNPNITVTVIFGPGVHYLNDTLLHAHSRVRALERSSFEHIIHHCKNKRVSLTQLRLPKLH